MIPDVFDGRFGWFHSSSWLNSFELNLPGSKTIDPGIPPHGGSPQFAAPRWQPPVCRVIFRKYLNYLGKSFDLDLRDTPVGYRHSQEILT